MTLSKRALGAIAVLALALCAGCRSCRQDDTAARDAAPAAVSEVRLELAPKPRFTALDWVDDPSPRGIGLPSGCTLELPLKKAPLPGGARFFADGTQTDALVIATGDERSLGARAIWDFAAKKSHDLPWDELDAPPLVARASFGWTAALVESVDATTSRALLWREGKTALDLGRGDRLELADLACAGARCALLTTLARPSAAPGATLAVGDATRIDGWQRVDLVPDPDAPWAPLAIARFDGQSAEVALGTGRRVVMFRVRDGASEKLGEIDTPHGSWDIVSTPAPISVSAGADVDAGCALDPFPLRLAGLTGKGREVGVSPPPDGVIARPLKSGAFVAWVAPITCQISERVIVHALRVDASGTPSSSPMGVADATGFALATDGDRLSLWLRTKQGVTWVRGRCP